MLWQYGIRLHVINDLLFLNHNGDAKSLPWRLKSLASTLFVQPFVQEDSQENIKALKYWSLVQRIHRWPMNPMMTSSNGNIFRVTGHLCGEFTSPGKFPTQSQWRGALMFSLICVYLNGWVNNHEAGDLRRYCAHYDVILMQSSEILVTCSGNPPMTDGPDSLKRTLYLCHNVLMYICYFLYDTKATNTLYSTHTKYICHWAQCAENVYIKSNLLLLKNTWVWPDLQRCKYSEFLCSTV